MRIEQIGISTTSDGEVQKVLAIATDLFAIHPTNGGGIEWDDMECAYCVAFTLTHRPTGYAVVCGRSWNEVLGYWSEIQSRTGIDWSLTDPEMVRTIVGPAFRDIKSAVEGRMLASRPAADAVDPHAGVTTE